MRTKKKRADLWVARDVATGTILKAHSWAEMQKLMKKYAKRVKK
jgi:hypothetical protein